MSNLVSLAKTDITDKNKQILYYRIVEHATHQTLAHFNTTGKAKNSELIKNKEVREYLCKIVIEQLYKSGNPNSIVVIGRDFNIALKYKKNTLMRLCLPGDYILMIYESPHICLPNLKHSHTACLEADDKYWIEVKLWDKSKSKEESKIAKSDESEATEQNIKEKDEFNEEVKLINFESIIKQNLSYVIMEYERDLKEKDKKVEFDLCDLPQMIAGMTNRTLMENETGQLANYSWHFVVSSPFPQNAESNHITSSTSHYYDLTLEQQNRGIFNVIHREYLVDFMIPSKNKGSDSSKMSKQQLHIVWYRTDRGHDTAIGKVIDSVKSIKITEILSIAFMHKFFFILLVVAYFSNRFVCGQYDKISEAETEDQDVHMISDHQAGYVESFWRRKNEAIVMIAVTFIVMSVIKQIFKRINRKR